MFTKLIFDIDEEEIELHLHEVVKLAKDIVDNEPGISPGTILKPDSVNQLIKENQGNNIALWYEGELDPYIFVPANISGIQNLKQWLFVAKYCATNKSKNDIHGWWIIVALRLIHIDLIDKFWYVSDHGMLGDIIEEVKEIAITLPWISQIRITASILKLKNILDGYTVIFTTPTGEVPNKTIYLYLESQGSSDDILKYKLKDLRNAIVTNTLDEIDIGRKNYNSIKRKILSKRLGQRLTIEEKQALIFITYKRGETKSFSYLSKKISDIKKNFINGVKNDSYENVKTLLPSITEQQFLKIKENHLNNPDVLEEQFTHIVEATTYLIDVVLNKFYELLSVSNNSTCKEFLENYKGYLEKDLNKSLALNDFKMLLNMLSGAAHDMNVEDERLKELIFNFQVLENYLRRFVLSEIAQEINLGKREPLYRPISSYGKKEVGDAYHEFSDTIQTYFERKDAISQQELAAAMRSLISGLEDLDDSLSFLPNLMVVWLIIEGARNHTTVLTTMMLIDLIENNVSLISNTFNLYDWKYTVINPYNNQPKQNVYDLYGDEITASSDVPGSWRLGGSHPMAHDGSAKQGGVLVGNLNMARQKEGSLILHWLYHHISSGCPELKIKVISFSHENKLSWAIKKPSYKEVNNDFKKINEDIKKIQGTMRVKESQNPPLNVDKQKNEIRALLKERKKLKLIHYLIKPLLKLRLESTENFMLNPNESIKPILTEFLSIITAQSSGIYLNRTTKFSAWSASTPFFNRCMNHVAFSGIVDKVLKTWDWAYENDKVKAARKTSINTFFNSVSFKKFSSKVQGYGFSTTKVSGDGNCFFQSVLKQLQDRHPEILHEIAQTMNISADIIDHFTLRTLTIGTLIALRNRSDHPEVLEENMNVYIVSQGRNGAWAEEEIIRATANVLGITFVLVNTDSNDPTVITEGNAGVLFLAYHVGTHFDALIGEPHETIQQFIIDKHASHAPSSRVSLEEAIEASKNRKRGLGAYGFKK